MHVKIRILNHMSCPTGTAEPQRVIMSRLSGGLLKTSPTLRNFLVPRIDVTNKPKVLTIQRDRAAYSVGESFPPFLVGVGHSWHPLCNVLQSSLLQK